MKSTRTIVGVAIGAVLAVATLSQSSRAGAGPAIALTVVADHLQNPRGLAMSADGRLFVAQAGDYTGSLTSSNTSGKITEIRAPAGTHPIVRDVATGLVSVFDPQGETLGLSGLSTDPDGNIFAIVAESNIGSGISPSLLGHLLRVTRSGKVIDQANVGDHDYRWTEAHQALAPNDFAPGDSNPYAVLADGDDLYVADAGANTLSVVHPDGQQQILAFFPNSALRVGGVTYDATPTCIAKGPDGALYVGTLSLIPSIVFGPSAVVYRVDPRRAQPNDLSRVLSLATPWATGLWPIGGCTFDHEGNFYGTELITNSGFSGGDVVKIPFAQPATHVSLTTPGSLQFPAGVAVSVEGSVYVVNKSTMNPGAGQVLRLRDR